MNRDLHRRALYSDDDDGRCDSDHYDNDSRLTPMIIMMHREIYTIYILEVNKIYIYMYIYARMKLIR